MPKKKRKRKLFNHRSNQEKQIKRAMRLIFLIYQTEKNEYPMPAGLIMRKWALLITADQNVIDNAFHQCGMCQKPKNVYFVTQQLHCQDFVLRKIFEKCAGVWHR